MKRKNNFEKKGLIWILTINRDHPQDAMPIDLRYRWDQKVLAYLKKRYVVCQFRNQAAYQKGRRLVGQHRKGQAIPIGRFRLLVKPFGYESQPLSKPAKEAIRAEHQLPNASVKKLADDWDVSESHIRSIIGTDKPPVRPSEARRNKGVFKGQPPLSNRDTQDLRGHHPAVPSAHTAIEAAVRARAA